MTSRTHTVPCVWGCGTMITLDRKPPKGGIGCGKGECLDKHNAAAEATRRDRRRAAPRSRQRAVVYGELGRALMLANPACGTWPPGPTRKPADSNAKAIARTPDQTRLDQTRDPPAPDRTQRIPPTAATYFRSC